MATDLELHLFDSGTLGLDGVLVPVPFYLIRHPHGNVVIDGGNPLAVARDAHAHWGQLADLFEVHMSEEQHCAVQLEQIGVGPDDVRYVVQTHLHIDHTGALGHFPAATVVAHERELEAARGAESPTASGYVLADFDRPELRWQLITGELDLYGDGAIRLIETPGHSAGHMSVLLQCNDAGVVLLTADASDNLAQWEGRARVRALFSRAQAASSLELLHQIARDHAATVVFGHDPEDWAGHKHAPEYYT